MRFIFVLFAAIVWMSLQGQEIVRRDFGVLGYQLLEPMGMSSQLSAFKNGMSYERQPHFNSTLFNLAIHEGKQMQWRPRRSLWEPDHALSGIVTLTETDSMSVSSAMAAASSLDAIGRAGVRLKFVMNGSQNHLEFQLSTQDRIENLQGFRHFPSERMPQTGFLDSRLNWTHRFSPIFELNANVNYHSNAGIWANLPLDSIQETNRFPTAQLVEHVISEWPSIQTPELRAFIQSEKSFQSNLTGLLAVSDSETLSLGVSMNAEEWRQATVDSRFHSLSPMSNPDVSAWLKLEGENSNRWHSIGLTGRRTAPQASIQGASEWTQLFPTDVLKEISGIVELGGSRKNLMGMLGVKGHFSNWYGFVPSILWNIQTSSKHLTLEWSGGNGWQEPNVFKHNWWPSMAWDCSGFTYGNTNLALPLGPLALERAWHSQIQFEIDKKKELNNFKAGVSAVGVWFGGRWNIDLSQVPWQDVWEIPNQQSLLAIEYAPSRILSGQIWFNKQVAQPIELAGSMLFTQQISERYQSWESDYMVPSSYSNLTMTIHPFSNAHRLGRCFIELGAQRVGSMRIPDIQQVQYDENLPPLITNSWNPGVGNQSEPYHLTHVSAVSHFGQNIQVHLTWQRASRQVVEGLNDAADNGSLINFTEFMGPVAPSILVLQLEWNR